MVWSGAGPDLTGGVMERREDPVLPVERIEEALEEVFMVDAPDEVFAVELTGVLLLPVRRGAELLELGVCVLDEWLEVSLECEPLETIFSTP